MSLTLHSTRQYGRRQTVTGSTNRASTVSAVSAIFRFARKAIVGGAKLFGQAAQAIAEARLQRGKIEAELYLNRYRHSSKNDDDLPIVRSAPAEQPAPVLSPRVVLERAAGAVAALAKKIFPVVFVLGFFALAVGATVAIRLAVWLPLYWH